jgi:hypothetical protein
MVQLHNVATELKEKAHSDSPLQHTGANNKGNWYGGQSIPHPNYELRKWIGELCNDNAQAFSLARQTDFMGTNQGSRSSPIYCSGKVQTN